MQYNQFSQLTQRAGNFLVSREPEPDFTWEDVKGKSIIGGRTGGLHYIEISSFILYWRKTSKFPFFFTSIF